MVALGLGAARQYAPPLGQRPGLSYTRETPPNRVRLPLPRVQGQALDHIGLVVPDVVLGLYSDPAPHRLLARAMSGPGGHFDFGKRIPPGNYRLIAMYPGTCTANIPLRVDPRAKHKKLQLRMEYPGLGVCSYALLR
jgi:hypothetical protein